MPRTDPCGIPSFFPGLEMLLLSGNEFGLILIYDQFLQLSACFESEGLHSIAISMDRKRIVTTRANYFRICRFHPLPI